MEAKIIGSMFGGLSVLAAFTLLSAAYCVNINTQLDALIHKPVVPPTNSRGMGMRVGGDPVDPNAAAEQHLIVIRGLSAGAVAILALGTIMFSILFAVAAKKAHDAAPALRAQFGTLQSSQ